MSSANTYINSNHPKARLSKTPSKKKKKKKDDKDQILTNNKRDGESCLIEIISSKKNIIEITCDAAMH